MIGILKPEEKTTYQVMLIAYKRLDEKIKKLVTKYSVLNIKDKETLTVHANIMGSGASFNLNDRIKIYLSWFIEDIMEKLDEGYTLDIIEIHKSYGDTRKNFLEILNFEYEDDILILNELEI
ncbi:MAG: hypothetical protein GX069_05440 [Tissierellia bacterium]|nr:hypothetical protein [Tissierellia bacterium]